MDNAYIKQLSIYLATDLRFWNYKPSKKPIPVYVYRSSVRDSKGVIYVPCKYKNKIIQLKAW